MRKFCGLLISAAALLGVAACQPAELPLLPADEPPQLNAQSLALGDGSQLPVKRWLPEDRDEPIAVILALHGFNDYSFAFDLPGRHFAAHGVAVYAYDQRGFGGNSPRGVWPGRANLLRDVSAAIEVIHAAHPGVPLYLLGESMGAAVAIAACAEDVCDTLAGVMLSAPALWGDDSISQFYGAGLWLLAHTIPESEWTGEDLDILASDNLPILYAMGDDPLVIKETRVDAVYGLVGLMREAFREIKMLKPPLLLMYGANDQVIPPFPVARAIDLTTAPLSVAYYPDGYHMLLRDKQREVVYRDMLSWIDNRYRPLPSAADMGWKEELLGVEE